MVNSATMALLNAISGGLKRRSIITCSRWAEKCRVMGKPFPGPWTFKYHPWTKEMHDVDGDWVGQKSAQMGYTETALDRVFFKIDVERTDCLYILPAKTPDASDFSAARFDPALELSPHLQNLFSSVKNVGHKRAGSANLYVRGSRSKSALKSIPAGLVVLDELEEMVQENVPLATERQSGQMVRQTIKISTPRIAGQGISEEFERTTKEHFFFSCPHCSRLTELIFPQCMEITAESIVDPKINDTYIKCKECHHKLDHATKYEWLANGVWVPEFTNRDVRGFYINQLYSSTESPKLIAESYFKAQNNEFEEQTFYNSKLGIVHEVRGARVTEEDFKSCIKGHVLNCQVTRNTLITMGVDQGKNIHYEVDAWHLQPYSNSIDINDTAIPKVIDKGSVREFEDLDDIMRKWGINAAIIDAQPEKRKAIEFANRFPGFVRLCYYGEGIKGKNVTVWSNEPTVSVDRTSWMDLALGRFRKQTISLPQDIGLEYRQHIKAPVRSYEKDQSGNPVGRWVVGNNVPDHFAHARVYAEIALPFASGLAQSQSTRSPR